MAQAKNQCLGSLARAPGPSVCIRGRCVCVCVGLHASALQHHHHPTLFLSSPLCLSPVHDRAVPPSPLCSSNSLRAPRRPAPMAVGPDSEARQRRWGGADAARTVALAARSSGFALLPVFRNSPVRCVAALGLAVILRVRRAPNSTLLSPPEGGGGFNVSYLALTLASVRGLSGMERPSCLVKQPQTHFVSVLNVWPQK